MTPSGFWPHKSSTHIYWCCMLCALSWSGYIYYIILYYIILIWVYIYIVREQLGNIWIVVWIKSELWLPDLLAGPTDSTCKAFLVPNLLAGPMDLTCEVFLVPDLLAGPTDWTCKAFETQTQDAKQHVVPAVWTAFKHGSAIPQWPELQTGPAVWFCGVTEPELNFRSGLEFEPGLLWFWTGLWQH